MKVTQEKLPASQISLEIEIPSETSKQAYEKVVQNLARTANIPGFRKGKVPRQILMQRIGMERIKAATVEEVLQTSLEAAIKQENVQAIGNYQVNPPFEELVKNFQPGEAITFKVAVDVPPTVELAEYRHLHIKAEEVVYEEKQVDEYLEEKRSQQATLVPVEDRSAQDGDRVIIDYQAYKLNENGEKEEPIAELKGVDAKVELVDGKLLPGMVEGIIGMHTEEVKEITVSFPNDYPRQELADAQVIFSITLKELKTKELPELDDEFAQEISEYQSIEELRNSLREGFQKKAQEETTSNIHQAILNELTTTFDLELPETYIDKEIQNILTQTAMQMEQYGVDVKTLFSQENLPKMRANARPDAVKRLKERLIIEEIAKTEAIKVEPAVLEQKIEDVKKELAGQPIDMQRLTAFLEEELSTEKTLNWLKDSAQVELVQAETQPAATETVDVEAVEVEALTEETPTE